MSTIEVTQQEVTIEVSTPEVVIEVEGAGPAGPQGAPGATGATGPTGATGATGAAGPANLYIQNATPSSPPATYAWFQTELGAGTDFTVWLEDGLA